MNSTELRALLDNIPVRDIPPLQHNFPRNPDGSPGRVATCGAIRKNPVYSPWREVDPGIRVCQICLPKARKNGFRG